MSLRVFIQSFDVLDCHFNGLNAIGEWVSCDSTRFGARVGIEMLGYQPSDILKMKFITKKAIPWFPEPVRWIGVTFTQRALIKADKNGGKRGLWLKFLDAFGLGFTC